MTSPTSTRNGRTASLLRKWWDDAAGSLRDRADRLAGLLRGWTRGVSIAQRVFVVGLCPVLFALHFAPLVLERPWLPRRWDLMFVTGVGVLLYGLARADKSEQKVGLALRRLADRGVLVPEDGNGTPVSALAERVQARAELAGWTLGLVLGGVTLSIVWKVQGLRDPELLPIALLGGFFAGYHLGRFASYGGIGERLRTERFRIQPQEQHPDKVAGLSPIGEMFYHQGVSASLPLLFVGGWSLVLFMWPRSAGFGYLQWRLPFLVLLAIALLLAILAFHRPMRSFRRMMADHKSALLAEADEKGQRIVQKRADLSKATDKKTRRRLREELSPLLKRWAAIEAMPTRPFDPARHRLLQPSVILSVFFAVVAPFTDLSEAWKGALSALTSP